MNTIADFLDSLYEYAEKHVVFRTMFFTFAIGLFISLLMVMFSMIYRPLPAFAASVTANNNQELIAAVTAGADTIDIRALGITEQPNIVTTLRYMDGMPRCLSRATTLSRAKGTNAIVRITPAFDCDKSQVAARNNAYWAEVNRLASSAQGTQYDKALYLYDSLMSRCSYNYASVSNRDEYNRHCTAASALLDGSSICAGYAEALVDLFRAVGIQAWVIETPAHAWVGCSLDGLTLSCDPTNDDANDVITHNNFMVKGDGSLYRPAAPAPAPSPAPQAPAAADPTPAVEQQAPAIETPAAEEQLLITSPAPEQRKERVSVDACPVRVLKGDMAQADETIYMPITSGCYSPFEVVYSTTLYTQAA